MVRSYPETRGVELLRQSFHILDGERVDDSRAVLELCVEHFGDGGHALVVGVGLGADLVEEVGPVKVRLELEAALQVENLLAVGCDLSVVK